MSEILGHNLAWTGRGRVMWEVGMGLGLQREPLLWSLPPCHLPRLGTLQPASPPAPRLPSIRLIVQKAEVQRRSSSGSLAMSVSMERALKVPELGKVSACRAEPSGCLLGFLLAGQCVEQRTAFPSVPWAKGALVVQF